MIPVKQALDGLSVFAVNDVIATMPNSMSKFIALMAVSAMRNDPQKFLAPYMGHLKSFGILNQDGTLVDEKVLKTALSEAFAEMPSVSWMGFTFTADDAVRLAARIGG